MVAGFKDTNCLSFTEMGEGLRCAAMVAAEGLHCTGGSGGLRGAAMVAAKGLHGVGGCQGLHRVATVAVKGLHCTDIS